MTNRLNFGFSPCPNDTYIFCGIAEGLIPTGGLAFEFVIDDVESLNQLTMDNRLQVSKVSCHAYYYLRDRYVFLRHGSAFGKGCGPLIVTKDHHTIDQLADKKIAVPGQFTTATLLLRLFYGKRQRLLNNLIVMPFNEIMPAVADGHVDAGVVIHEGRFTFANYGLKALVDLGMWWEQDTGLPIPLGGIVARSDLGKAMINDIDDLIRQSISYADRDLSSVMPFIKRHAQELSDEVIMNHIRLYVNQYTRAFDTEAQRALDELIKRTEGVEKWIKA